MKNIKLFSIVFVVLILSSVLNARPFPNDDEDVPLEQPGWWRRQFQKLGNAAERVGSTVGGTAYKLTAAVEKICSVIKKVIPIVGAICTAGQFQFCSLDNGTGAAGVDTGTQFVPGGSNIAISGPVPIDLNMPD